MAHVAWGTGRARGVLATTVLGSGIAFLDTTIVNVALPSIGRALGTGLTGLQWTVDAYLLTLTAFVLPGGAAGDRLGRRRVFVIGLAGFGLASAGCGLAPNAGVLAATRAAQGLFAALLVPGSLALLRECFADGDQARAIGAWAALSGVATALGPLAGGWLASVGWRAIFFVNVPLVALAIASARRFVPAARPRAAVSTTGGASTAGAPLDLPGAGLVAAGLAALTYALIEATARGATADVLVAAAFGLFALAAFLVVEHRSRAPMLPLGVFRSRAFSATNLLTLVVYFGLGGATFLLMLQLQAGLGWSPLHAGAAMLPLTALLFVLSPLAGRAAARHGPRPLLTAGPFVAAAGLALLARVGDRATYAADVLPGVLVLGVGLGLTVAPLTTAVLASVDATRAGVASGVNNAVARLAGLLAVAALPLFGGAAPQAVATGALGPGYARAMAIAALITASGGVAGWLSAPSRRARPARRAPGVTAPAASAPPARSPTR